MGYDARECHPIRATESAVKDISCRWWEGNAGQLCILCMWKLRQRETWNGARRETETGFEKDLRRWQWWHENMERKKGILCTGSPALEPNCKSVRSLLKTKYHKTSGLGVLSQYHVDSVIIMQKSSHTVCKKS